MKKVMIIINPTSGGETALDYIIKRAWRIRLQSILIMLKLRLRKKLKMQLNLLKGPLKKNMMQ